MSFILDALKKSENERQRHHGPSMMDIPYGRPRSAQPLWMALIVVLLLVNLGVLWFFVRPKNAPAPAQPTATAPQAAAPEVTAPAAAPTAPAAPAPTPSPTAPPTDVRPLAAEAYAEPSIEAAEEPATPAPASEPKLVRRVEDSSSTNADTGNVTTLEALGGPTSLNLPELHLDIHVYSTKPAERFVFINMRKYQEGQTLNEGPTVQRIASDGVILSYRNQQFLLPRQ